MDMSRLSGELLYSADPEQLNSILISQFFIDMPEKADSPEDLATISHIMATIVGYLQFLMPHLTVLKIRTQNLKASGAKEEYKIMMQRRDVVEVICDILKTQRDTLSRMITIKQEINKEINMV